MKKYIFFTLNDFEKDGGGTVRMRGIVNALAEAEQQVVLISNAKTFYGFHSSIDHLDVGVKISKRDKRIFQLLLTLSPNFLTKIIFKNYLSAFSLVFKKEGLIEGGTVIFFEYLDNSIGLFLNKQKVISEYINDTHGSARLEFLYKNPSGIFGKVLNVFKYLVAIILDKKLYKNSGGTLFLSNAMKEYFEKYYIFTASKKNYVVRDGISNELQRHMVNKVEVNRYRKSLDISIENKVILFAGNFKNSGGVLDLIEAFHLIVLKGNIPNIRLLLIGDGECFDEARNFSAKKHLEEKVSFIGRVPYSELRNYQELANVIVCPDRQHQLSELVPHIKYFDALVSGKIVINGSFASIRDINQDERLSIDFKPSDINDLSVKIEKVLLNQDEYMLKFQNQENIFNEFSYNNAVKALLVD